MEEEKYPGKVKISAFIDERFGEMWFEVEGRGRITIQNKCLYDALSKLDIASCRNYYVHLKDYRIFYEEDETESVKTAS